jgi:all-trans-retinol 13,14-reductase
MNYARGEVYGVAATPARFRSRVLGPRTPITNLYLSGQDVSSLGVTGAMFGGALAASAVLGRNMVSRMTKS